MTNTTSRKDCTCIDFLQQHDSDDDMGFELCPLYKPYSILEKCSYSIHAGNTEMFYSSLSKLEGEDVNGVVLEFPVCMRDHDTRQCRTSLLLTAYYCDEMEMLFALLEHKSINIHKKDTKRNSLLCECIKDDEYELMHEITEKLSIVVTENNYRSFEEYLIDIIQTWPIREIMLIMEKLQVKIMYERDRLYKNLLLISLDRKDGGLVTFMLNRLSPSMLQPMDDYEDCIPGENIPQFINPPTPLEKIVFDIDGPDKCLLMSYYSGLIALFTCIHVPLDFSVNSWSPDAGRYISKPYLGHFFWYLKCGPNDRWLDCGLQLMIDIFKVHGIKPHSYMPLSSPADNVILKRFDDCVSSYCVKKSARK